ncbi:Protein of unknown function [Granulicella rosea]|uniref:DUF3037 domain-containing protein n=1 Tax=Granulicella rosea TaxID=474952 RepID=A0A239H9U8_9BACT|nr:DUF3037 domain-containing protein [Granulicella rosea]SNS77593.1 Protein of unknown function [Granulicella rosea]
MHTSASYDYAVLRVVPRVDRQEFVNIGVIVLCRERRYLAARIHVDEARLRALWPQLDIDAVRRHADAVLLICAGEDAGGPIARLSQSERFHWLTSPRSTIMQTSPVHTGLCVETGELLERLYRGLVALIARF